MDGVNYFYFRPSLNDSRPQVIELRVYHGAARKLEGILEVISGLLRRGPVPGVKFVLRVRFHTLNRATGNRVKRQFIDPATGEPVENEEQVKGL